MIQLKICVDASSAAVACDVVSIDREASFRELLSILRRFVHNAACSGFSYIDDDGDRITVNEDDDFVTFREEILSQIDSIEIITIYPLYDTDDDDDDDEEAAGDSYARTSRGSQLTISTSDTTSIPNLCSSSDLSSSSALSVNSVRLDSLLGCGRSAEVFRAVDLKTNRSLAVKRMDVNLADDENKEFEIMSELEILRSCHSPYIIAFFGAFFSDAHIHICVEFMDGLSLDRYGVIHSEAVLCGIAVPVVRGLHCLWCGGIMHRDLKPSNILVNYRGEVKLGDFNISTRMARSIAETFIGTYLYMAPERITQPEYRYSADIWSLGVCLFELGTGTLPFLLDDDEPGSMPMDQVMERIVQYTQPRPLPDRFSEEFGQFVYRCLCKQAQERWTLNDLLECDWLSSQFDSDEQRLLVVRDWLLSVKMPLTPPPMSAE